MAIQEGVKQNFKTLQLAMANEDVALVECTNSTTGEIVIAICAVSRMGDGSITMSPLAKMFSGNPFDELTPP